MTASSIKVQTSDEVEISAYRAANDKSTVVIKHLTSGIELRSTGKDVVKLQQRLLQELDNVLNSKSKAKNYVRCKLPHKFFPQVGTIVHQRKVDKKLVHTVRIQFPDKTIFAVGVLDRKSNLIVSDRHLTVWPVP